MSKRNRLSASSNGFIVWTPSLVNINGQNIVTRYVVETQHLHIEKTYQYPTHGSTKILGPLWLGFSLLIAVLMRKDLGLYLVCSRSTAGFFRDALPLSAGLFKKRVVVHVHGVDLPHLLDRPLIGRLARFLYQQCELVVPSAQLAEALSRFRFKSVKVCENFSTFDQKAMKWRAPLNHGPETGIRVLWNSNIMASKGVVDLVDGLRILRSKGHDVSLELLGVPIGDAERTKGEMAAYITQWQKEPWVKLRGKVAAKDMRSMIDWADVVCLPSYYSSECQPLAIIEAMIAGRIVIVSPTPALVETVGDYPAEFVEKSPISIAEGIERSLSSFDPELQYAASVRSWDRFKPSRFDARIREILYGSQPGTVATSPQPET